MMNNPRKPFKNSLPFEWKYKEAGKVFSESKEHNKPQLPLLSVTREEGVIPQAESTKRDISSKNKEMYKVIRPNYIVYNTMRMWQGVSAVSKNIGIVSPAYTVLKPEKELDTTFIGYLFKYPPMINVFRRYSQGLVDDTLNLKYQNFKKILLPMPPLKEQQKIAAILSSVDEAIEKTGQIIEQTELIKKGLMQELLTKGIGHTEFRETVIGKTPMTWESNIINDVAQFEGGSQPPRDTFVFEPTEGYTRLIQIRDFKTDKFQTFIPTHLAKKFCEEDDIMIGRYGPPIFQILRGIRGAYNVALIKAIPNENLILKDYLYYILAQEKLYILIDRLSQRTSGQTGIDIEALKNFPIVLPTLQEQSKIVSILKENEDSIENEKAHLRTLNKLKQGLMQQLLTGKKRVKVDDSEEVLS